ERTDQAPNGIRGVGGAAAQVGRDDGPPPGDYSDQGVQGPYLEKFVAELRRLDQPQPKPPTIRNLIIAPLTQDQLHAQWPRIRRGAEDILKKMGPHSHWIPEDLYAALRYPEASHAVLFMASRNEKLLAWMCCELQRDRYGLMECFVWNGWDIPLRERRPQDDVPGARDQLTEYVRVWARSQGCYRIACLSPRPLDRIGWTKGHTNFYQLV
ncbi:MAG TPA: hypothetical protein VKD24_07170, partial [Candidatus Angelobacter sp.]|nr:hypothetical protein [Candidatus Angelobacter sp.]